MVPQDGVGIRGVEVMSEGGPVKKRKYFVVGEVTISAHIKVEATSEEEAREIASKAGNMTICYKCAMGEEDAWSTCGELDGEVTITAVELA